MAFVVWVWYTRTVPFGVVHHLVVGLAVGVVSNRFLFGVVRGVPEARIRRERAA